MEASVAYWPAPPIYAINVAASAVLVPQHVVDFQSLQSAAPVLSASPASLKIPRATVKSQNVVTTPTLSTQSVLSTVGAILTPPRLLRRHLLFRHLRHRLSIPSLPRPLLLLSDVEKAIRVTKQETGRPELKTTRLTSISQRM